MSNTVGFAVIIILYVVIGLLAAAGSAVVSQKLFPGRSEQIFYGVFLTPIAGFLFGFRGLLRECFILAYRVVCGRLVLSPRHSRHTIRCSPDPGLRLTWDLGRSA